MWFKNFGLLRFLSFSWFDGIISFNVIHFLGNMDFMSLSEIVF